MHGRRCPANSALVTADGTLTVATDLGVFTSTSAGRWSRLGTTLPTAPSVYLAPSPDGRGLYVATHGRGIWKTAMP